MNLTKFMGVEWPSAVKIVTRKGNSVTFRVTLKEPEDCIQAFFKERPAAGYDSKCTHISGDTWEFFTRYSCD